MNTPVRQPAAARGGAAARTSRARVRPPESAVEATPAGAAFFSERAPRPSSAAEADFRARLAARLDVDLALNAIRVRSPFHKRYEVWPDIVMPELLVAIEYDTTGRSATEHVGSREASDRRKDQLLRQTGWEVVRIRTSRLEPLGPFDITCSGVTDATIERVIEQLKLIRGDLIVSAYLRRKTAK